MKAMPLEHVPGSGQKTLLEGLLANKDARDREYLCQWTRGLHQNGVKPRTDSNLDLLGNSKGNGALQSTNVCFR